MARLAIPAYVESAIRLESAAPFPVFIERLHRAIQLAHMVGQGDSALLASVTSEIEKLTQKRAPAETKRSCADLMQLHFRHRCARLLYAWPWQSKELRHS
jgi:hypothetical protein